MMFSIIIPVKEINDYIRTAMPHYKNMEFDDYEILIFPDHVDDAVANEAVFKDLGDKVRIIPSGETGPAEKRDMALEYAKGEYIAFIDDDAYPAAQWLTKAYELLQGSDVGAVGGPAVTAPEDDIWQQASGKTYESKLCSAGYTYRYIPEPRRDVDDLPSVNLIVKADLFKKIGGYDSNYYPGEDTKLCLDIVNTGHRIIYDPEILVYHHRRRMFKAHLKQATNYAKHRGYFAKVLPQTSRKFAYFVPSLFVLGLILGPILAIFFPFIWYIYGGVLALYFVLLALSIHKPGSFSVWILTMAGIFTTHVGYGIRFVQGLLSKELLR
ncbi:glycosyltransferase [Butyrivibrio sp. TB]|uniref:glycosyltransferase n=1 Tax=Butyrivibrio sp. TB TaxID=1520809 RepID=UPI0008BC615E|nr:glycosyltransferase [Butyrivibrio sp. TB]SEQ36595.1 Glycosyltransferase, catalytic subunit of cellulose synthase and poly-beta-1,6-N-acetylglucosamine synthase [Butyrivibrio sp. TB]